MPVNIGRPCSRPACGARYSRSTAAPARSRSNIDKGKVEAGRKFKFSTSVPALRLTPPSAAFGGGCGHRKSGILEQTQEHSVTGAHRRPHRTLLGHKLQISVQSRAQLNKWLLLWSSSTRPKRSELLTPKFVVLCHHIASADIPPKTRVDRMTSCERSILAVSECRAGGRDRCPTLSAIHARVYSGRRTLGKPNHPLERAPQSGLGGDDRCRLAVQRFAQRPLDHHRHLAPKIEFSQRA